MPNRAFILLIPGTGGDDDSFCGERFSGLRFGDVGAGGKIHFRDQIMHQIGSDFLGLFAHLLHQPGALNHIRKAGKIFHIGGDGQLTARLHSGNKARLQGWPAQHKSRRCNLPDRNR